MSSITTSGLLRLLRQASPERLTTARDALAGRQSRIQTHGFRSMAMSDDGRLAVVTRHVGAIPPRWGSPDLYPYEEHAHRELSEFDVAQDPVVARAIGGRRRG